MNNSVAVIGLGYVGLPLALEITKKNIIVFGVDIDTLKVDELNSGKSVIEDINTDYLKSALRAGKLKITSDFSSIAKCGTILICVPTPLNPNRTPDLVPLLTAVASISPYLSSKSLVIIESTIATGTTRNQVLPLMERLVKFPIDELNLAYSPERVDPSNKTWNLQNTPKIISGISEKSKNLAVKFYAQFVDNVIECDSVEIAETAKLLENSFRLVNISFINEMAKFCHAMGVDIIKVIEAAATKPYGFMKFYPSIGIGGHCIPVDPLYLSKKAKEVESPLEMIDLADKINCELPLHFVHRAKHRINGIAGKKILVIGVSYKPNVADVREAPALALIQALRKGGAQVDWHDELVKYCQGEQSTPISDEYDLAIIATAHDYLNLSNLGSVPILTAADTRL